MMLRSLPGRAVADSGHGDSLQVFIHDVPGFFIGRDGERKRVARKIITWMDAPGMATVPRVSIVLAGCPNI
jgi:acetyl-CoA carboxylase carboxyltransferase component